MQDKLLSKIGSPNCLRREREPLVFAKFQATVCQLSRLRGWRQMPERRSCRAFPLRVHPAERFPENRGF